jgi:hypothetical protein
MASASGGGKGNKKYGRQKTKKALGRTHPISLFVRNKISAKTYWEMTNQSLRSAVKDSSD